MPSDQKSRVLVLYSNTTDRALLALPLTADQVAALKPALDDGLDPILDWPVDVTPILEAP